MLFNCVEIDGQLKLGNAIMSSESNNPQIITIVKRLEASYKDDYFEKAPGVIQRSLAMQESHQNLLEARRIAAIPKDQRTIIEGVTNISTMLEFADKTRSRSAGSFNDIVPFQLTQDVIPLFSFQLQTGCKPRVGFDNSWIK